MRWQLRHLPCVGFLRLSYARPLLRFSRQRSLKISSLAKTRRGKSPIPNPRENSMANGVASAARLSEPAPEPDMAVEEHIGELMVALLGLSVRACLEVRAGGRVDPATKARGGDLMAQLTHAQAQFEGDGFIDAVNRIGRDQYCAAGLSTSSADKAIFEILQTVDRINAAVRSMAH